MEEKVRVCINVPKDLLKEFDRVVYENTKGTATRTYAILLLMRRYIIEVQGEKL